MGKGFNPKHKELVIKFEEEEYESLEVAVRPVTIKEALEAEKLQNIGDDATMEDLEKVFALAAGFVVRWNIEDDDGKTMPINSASFISFPMDFALALLSGINTTIAGVSAPLDDSSPNGEISPVVSVPMETL